MSAKNKDPFNFDDIYKQAGMGGFVKKSMAEQKASSTAAPRPASMAPSPPAKAPMPNGSAAAASRPIAASPSPRPAASSGLGSHTSSASSLVGLEDPFASLGVSSKASQPMKGSARSASPAGPVASKRPADSPQPIGSASMQYGRPGSDSPGAAATALSTSAPMAAAAPVAAFDLDDMFGMSGRPPAASPAAAAGRSAAPQDGAAAVGGDADPFAAFEAVDGAAPAVAAPATAADEPLAFEDDFGFPAATYAPSTQPDSPPAAPSAAAAAASPPRPAPKAATTYFAMYEEGQSAGRGDDHSFLEPPSVRQPEHNDEDRFARASSYEARHSTSTSYNRLGDSSTDAGSARESEHHSSHGSSKTVLGGFLKGAAAWGKKGLKAAQAGLQQLESALENMDGKPSSGTASPRHGSGRHHYNDGQEGGVEEDVPAEQVLQIAIRVSEMPSRQQEEKLARLPRSVRMKVQAILREQAVLEGEGSLPPPVTSPVAPRSNSRANVHAVDIQTQEFDLDAAAAGPDPSPPRRAPAPAAPPAQQRPASQPVRQQPSPAPQAPAEDDLLGVGGTTAAAAVASRQAAPSPAARPAAAAAAAAAAHAEEDLLGLSSRPAAAAAQAQASAAPKQRAPPVQDVADVDDFFAGGSSKPATSSTAAKPAGAVHGSSSAGQLGGLLGRGAGSSTTSKAAARPGSSVKPPKASSMIDLGGLDALHSNVDVSGHAALYGGVAGEEGEPEVRRQLRAAREAEKHAKMKQALAEKLAKEEEEKRRREGQQEHKQVHRERIDAWRNKNKGNVRGLLGSLQTVLWEDSGWKPIGMGDLLEPAQVRKAWMKANLLVHPDKVRQRQDSDERVAIADMIFDALKQAMENLR